MFGEPKNASIKYRIDIYIGSDNDSRRISDDYLKKIKKWASETFPEAILLSEVKAITTEFLKILFSFMHS